MIYLNTPLKKMSPVLEEAPNLSKYKREIESNWAKVIKQLPQAWNGEHLSCKRICSETNKTTLTLCKVDYKTHLWAKKHECSIPGTNLIGVGSIGYNPKSNTLTLGERSSTVGTFQNQIHVIGGGLDYDKRAIEDFALYVQNHAEKELREEVEIASERTSHKTKLHFMYSLFDEATSYLSIRFIYHGDIKKPKNNEFTKLVSIPLGQIDKFIAKHRQKIAPPALITLELLKVPSLAKNALEK